MTIIRIVNANIGEEIGKVDAVVNAANEHLQLLDGVAGAIRRACGTGLQAECNELIREMKVKLKMDKVPTGGVALTSSYCRQPTRGENNRYKYLYIYII